jgi:hypothetical protein
MSAHGSTGSTVKPIVRHRRGRKLARMIEDCASTNGHCTSEQMDLWRQVFEEERHRARKLALAAQSERHNEPPPN